MEEGELLQWIKTKTNGYQGVKIEDFTSSWINNNGLSFLALIHSHIPSLLPSYAALVANSSQKNLQLLFDAAKALGVPDDILTSKDLTNGGPRDMVLRAKIIDFLLHLSRCLTETQLDNKFPGVETRSRSSSLGLSSKIKSFISPKPKDNVPQIPEWIDTVKKIQERRFQKRLNDLIIIKCQRIIRNWLRRRKRTFFNIVIEYKKSPLSQDAKKRQHIWKEIIDTEKSYLAKLIYVVQKYRVPMNEVCNTPNQILSLRQLDHLFGNIEEVKHCSKVLLQRLNAEVASTISGNHIGEVFVSMTPIIQQAFLPYVLNFDGCVETYNEAVKNEKYLKFERECEKDPRGSLLNLTDILIMPVQRVPRYQLLFEQLLKLTPPDHVDYASIKEALELISHICRQTNDSKKYNEIMEVMWDLKVVIETDSNDIVEIVTPVYIAWEVKEVIARIKRKVPQAKSGYGLFLEKQKLWMEDTKTLFAYYAELNAPDTVIVFQKRNPFHKRTASLPKLFNVFSKSATTLPAASVNLPSFSEVEDKYSRSRGPTLAVSNSPVKRRERQISKSNLLPRNSFYM